MKSKIEVFIAVTAGTVERGMTAQPPVTTRSAQPSVAGRESSLAALLGFSRASTAEVA